MIFFLGYSSNLVILTSLEDVWNLGTYELYLKTWDEAELSIYMLYNKAEPATYTNGQT